MLKINRFRIVLPLLLLVFAAEAQNNKYRLTDLPLNDLSSFKTPSANWAIAGNIQADYTAADFKFIPGTGLLTNQLNPKTQPNAKNIFTNFEHGDLYLELDYNVPKGSNSGVYFQSRYEIQVFDSWGVAKPRAVDNGSIYERWDEKRPEGQKGYEGHPPLKNASFAPGLWQHLEVLFQAPRFDASGKKTADARFLFVKLNGIVIHENIILSGPTRAAAFENEVAKAPLMLQGDHGVVAFRNIRYAPQNDLNAQLKNLTYTYTEGKFEEAEDALKAKPTRTGTAAKLDSRLADARNGFLLAFDGTLEVPETDNYFFSMLVTGDGYLEIDGKPVIKKEWTWVGAAPLTGTANLTAGEHKFRAWNSKQVGWAPAGWSLFIQKPNTKMVPLHTSASMPERPPAPLIEVKAGTEPELVRSFQFKGKKKLTHVISVGDPSGAHYSYDLLQGALLQVWKGDFLDATEMWHERGEPQVSVPMGAPIVLSGRCPVAADSKSLPDSSGDYIYKGYRLNKERQPVFEYEMKGNAVTDLITPWEKGRGLSRTITLKNGSIPETAVFRIAEGKTITDLGKGLFAVNGQEYYLKILSSDGQGSMIQSHSDGQVLLAPAKSGSLQYIYIW